MTTPLSEATGIRELSKEQDMPTYSWEGSPLWKLWGRTIAEKWSGNVELIKQVEQDPTQYIQNAMQKEGFHIDPHVKFVLHNTDNQTVAVDGENVTYVMPWPAHDKHSNDISILAGGPPDPNKPNQPTGSGGGGGGGGGDCCCCCCVCCCC